MHHSSAIKRGLYLSLDASKLHTRSLHSRELHSRDLHSRRLAWLGLLAALFVFAGVAQAQQFDLAVGGSTLMSTQNTSASLNYPMPAEKAGTYPSASVERLFKNHFGYSVEGAFRYHYGIYNHYQTFRPILYDVNGVFAPRLTKRANGDLMAGIGGQHLVFYSPYYGCPYSAGCATRYDSNQFLVHLSADVHYRVWRNFFVRPEAHYYRIVNNAAFHSDNVLRLGASVGYTFHRD